jgi:hypothetical protein
MRKQFVLDKQADKLLNELAYYFGGNRSMVIREVTGAIAGSMPGTGWSTAGWWRIRFISGASGARAFHDERNRNGSVLCGRHTLHPGDLERSRPCGRSFC